MRIRPHGCTLCGMALHQKTRTVNVVQPLNGQVWHTNGPLGRGLQSPLSHQAPQGLAHRHHAGVKRLGQITYLKGLTALQTPADQRVGQLGINTVLHRITRDRAQHGQRRAQGFWAGGIASGSGHAAV